MSKCDTYDRNEVKIINKIIKNIILLSFYFLVLKTTKIIAFLNVLSLFNFRFEVLTLAVKKIDLLSYFQPKWIANLINNNISQIKSLHQKDLKKLRGKIYFPNVFNFWKYIKYHK